MGVGRIGGGGGRRGGPGKAKGAGPSSGASGAGKAEKAGGSGFDGRVGASESLVGVSRFVGPGNVAAADPVTAMAVEIARQLKSGEIKSREEATRMLVAEVLKEKVRMSSKALSSKIADQLQDDPRLSKALERLWQSAEQQQA